MNVLKRLQECGFHISSWFPLVNLIAEFWDGGMAVSRVMIIHKCMIAAGLSQSCTTAHPLTLTAVIQQYLCTQFGREKIHNT